MEKFTGLTLSEQMKLKKLKKSLAGDNGNSGKQISTQQTITFDKMYHDGICKVKKNYYTKMIEFYDLNYVLLDEDERADILGLYSQFINYFDPSISFQIFLFNRHVNEETLAAQFDISAQGDKFDDIREEFSDMLKNLSAKGNNGVIKSKYIIYGIEAENLKEARQRFISLDADIVKNLKNLGTNAKSLDGKERLRILYEFFNQDKMEPFRFSFKEMAESGNSVKDYIALAGINKKVLAKLGGQTHCFMADEDVARLAKERGVTRAVASMEKARNIEKPVIFAVGNAPTALIRLYEMIQEGNWHPAFVIGVPVGFVNVEVAKELIMETEVPYIVNRGRKGGSNVAAAICNALLYELTR